MLASTLAVLATAGAAAATAIPRGGAHVEEGKPTVFKPDGKDWCLSSRSVGDGYLSVTTQCSSSDSSYRRFIFQSSKYESNRQYYIIKIDGSNQCLCTGGTYLHPSLGIRLTESQRTATTSGSMTAASTATTTPSTSTGASVPRTASRPTLASTSSSAATAPSGPRGAPGPRGRTRGPRPGPRAGALRGAAAAAARSTTKWLALPVLGNLPYLKYNDKSGGHAGHDSMHLKKNKNFDYNLNTSKQSRAYPTDGH